MKLMTKYISHTFYTFGKLNFVFSFCKTYLSVNYIFRNKNDYLPKKLVHRNSNYNYHILIFFKIISFISLIILLTTILQSWSNHDFYKLIEIKSSNNGWFNSSGWVFRSLMQSYAQPKKLKLNPNHVFLSINAT